jgi:hypothetical protein
LSVQQARRTRGRRWSDGSSDGWTAERTAALTEIIAKDAE